jgi:hypothetical protein
VVLQCEFGKVEFLAVNNRPTLFTTPTKFTIVEGLPDFTKYNIPKRGKIHQMAIYILYQIVENYQKLT